MRPKDKVAVIAGAASGIGREIAVVFAREGASVVIAGLARETADATTRDIGGHAIGVAKDVSADQQVEAGIAKVVSTYGALDILISNAGTQTAAPIVELEFAKRQRMLAIHLDGAFLTRGLNRPGFARGLWA